MSEIKTLKYKKTLRIAGICIICWLYALAFAALASSCSGEDESAGRNMAKTALLRLNVSGTGAASTRATAAALPENESAVHRLAIGLFYADGSVNTIVESAVESGGTAGTLAVKDILCSPGVCDVIVIANVPEGTFAGVQTKNEFVGKNVSLVQTVRNGQQASDLLPMSGISEQPVTLEAGKTVSASINLSRLVTRISISSIRSAFSLNYAGATFMLDRIFLCNALEASRVSPGDVTQTMPANPAWLHGGMTSEQPDGSFLWTEGAGFLLNDVTPSEGILITSDEYTVPYWFYAFANNDAANRTKLVLSGYFDPDGSVGPKTPVYVYYPIVVNRLQTGTIITPSGSVSQDGTGDGTIVRNRDYRIKAVIKGDGEPTPGTEVVPSNLELTVSVDDWTLKIVQEVELD